MKHGDDPSQNAETEMKEANYGEVVLSLGLGAVQTHEMLIDFKLGRWQQNDGRREDGNHETREL